MAGFARTPGNRNDADDGGNNSSSGRDTNLYQELPAIEIQGNEILRDNPYIPDDDPYYETRYFNPQTPMESEWYDSDNDGIVDTPINDIESFGNAANRLLDIELAACVSKPPVKHDGYADPMVWTDEWVPIDGTNMYKYQFPDTMPATADAYGTDGTQFLQLIIPFDVDPESIFDQSQPSLDYLDPDFLTITDEDGNHVFCTVLIDGVDVNNEGPGGSVNPYQGAELELKGVNFDPGPDASSIVFIAQGQAGQTGSVPDDMPFNPWSSGKSEIRIHLIKAKNKVGYLIALDSQWLVMKEGGQPDELQMTGITPTNPVTDTWGNPVIDPDGNFILTHRDTDFIIRFNKPVIPETVGQSIVFGGPPFNGNTAPLPSSLAWNPPPPGQNPCDDNGTYFDPVAPNVALITKLIFPDGTPGNTEAVIPFRCHPLHQNNLTAYVLNPTIDLPGSSDLGYPPFQDPSVTEITRMRLTVQIYMHDENEMTGKPDLNAGQPVNMGACGFFKATMNLSDGVTFTINSGGRHVNAPVSPMALYYAMGPNGLGVVDLDGNGFTTNDPDFSMAALVTSERFYNRFGNSGMGIGNNYSYGAKATGGPPYVGLGSTTPMPGVNEGSTGIDEVVRDSNGNPMLFPDPDDLFCNISDVEVGEFLDTVFFDAGNGWAHKSFHLSAINIAATGIWANNLISTPPTPNPPPLSIPIGMRPTHVTLDEFGLSDEGAFVITGKEVFTVDLPGLGVGYAPNTGFIHLMPAELAGSPCDESFPPNRSQWPGSSGPSIPDYMNLGPVAESSTIGIGWYYGSRQQIGNFLFVADKSNNQVRVLNSNTMELITSLTGLSSPDSVAVSCDLKKLYVSNSGSGYVTVFNVNPKSDGFLNPITNIQVGTQPKGICCQPDMEDVLVCNYGSNTISIINPATNTVRKTVSSLVNKPWDLVAAPRQFTGLGFSTGVYHAYISNYGGNNVLVFESGPDGFGGIGYDDILDSVPQTGPNGQQFLLIQDPRGICYDPLHNHQQLLAGGCYVAHRSGSHAVVSRIQFYAQQGPHGPHFIDNFYMKNIRSGHAFPGFGIRSFLITSQWGGPANPLSGTSATDVALLDYNRECWLYQNWLSSFYVTSLGDLGENPAVNLPSNNKHPIRIVGGAINQTLLPDRLYVSYQYTPVIDVVDPASSQVVKTITGLPSGAKVLKTYFKF